ncbi:MAG: ZIP family metal transporter [Candidatus Obscuribacterales bacterium]
MDLLLHTLTWALIPTLSMIVGAVIALIKPPSTAIRSIILHFAAGVVFSVVAVELLPDIVKKHAPLEITIGFTAGVAVMLFLRVASRRIADKDDANADAELPVGLLFGIAVDLILDGLLLGIGFAAGNSEGMMLAFALSLELLTLGLATTATLRTKAITKTRTFSVILVLSSLLAIASIIGTTLLRRLDNNALEIVLSFGLAALLYLVTEELLVEAHEEEETPFHTASFFLGFLVLLILGMVAH